MRKEKRERRREGGEEQREEDRRVQVVRENGVGRIFAIPAVPLRRSARNNAAYMPRQIFRHSNGDTVAFFATSRYHLDSPLTRQLSISLSFL